MPQTARQRRSRPGIVFLAPIVPAPSGNGLAMRAGLQLEALAQAFAVRLAVLPVAGGSTDTAWARAHAEGVQVLDLEGLAAARRTGLIELVARAEWRRRLTACGPLPHAATVAEPALAATVVERLGLTEPLPVHAFRSYLAPLAVAVGEQLGSAQLTIDLDDDDEALLASIGDHAEAAAFGRLLACFGREFAWLSLASAVEARAVAARHGARTVVIPNAVEVQADQQRARATSSEPVLLFVGNLTYGPNVEAAEILARELVPRVRAQGFAARAELIGAYSPAGPIGELGGLAWTDVRGQLPDLADAYGRASIAVVPLRHAAGTRIKLLEAFAHRVPVVATPAAAAGIDAVHGRELLLAENVEDLAAAIVRLLGDPALADELTDAAAKLVLSTYAKSVVERRLLELVGA